MTGAGPVYVAIGCDTDPDRVGFLEDVPTDTLAWRGMLEGIPALKASVADVVDDAGRAPVFTWLLRADEQVRDTHGSYGWVVRTHGAFLRQLAATGDELGWHPHFWRRDRAGGPWLQDAGDVDWQVAMLEAAHADVTDAMGAAPRTVRMGWAYHNDRTYATLERLGVAVECSAIPGLRTFHEKPPVRGNNLYDWFATPRVPYCPSRSDYRRPARGGEAASRLLQVPVFVSTSRAWGLVAGVQMLRKTGRLACLADAVRRPTYQINLTARPRYFRPIVAQLRRTVGGSGRRPVFVACTFHPDELLPNRSVLYGMESVRENIAALLRAGRDAGRTVEFVRSEQLPALWERP